MKFTNAAICLLLGTAVAAPTTIVSSNDESASQLGTRFIITPDWFDRFNALHAGTETPEGELDQRSPVLIFPHPGTWKDNNGGVQRRHELFSDEELATIGSSVVEALEELSPEQIEELSSLAPRDGGLAEGQLGKREPFILWPILLPLLAGLDKQKNDKDVGVQRRAEPLLSESQLISIGRSVVDALEGLSTEELDELSSLMAPEESLWTGEIVERDPFLGLFETHMLYPLIIAAIEKQKNEKLEVQSRSQSGPLERRFLDKFAEALVKFLKEKFGLDKLPANTPALARRFFPALTPNLYHANMASSQEKQGEKVERRAEAVFNETELANMERLLFRTMEEYFPEAYSRLVARDGDAEAGETSLTRRGFFIPALVVAWAASITIAAIDAALLEQKKKEGRDLGSLDGVGEAFNQNLATLQMPPAVKEYLQEHTLLDAFAEVFPEGIKNIDVKLVVRDENDSIGTSGGALERRSPFIALPIGVLAYLAAFTIAMVTTSTPREDASKMQRRDLDGVGSAFDTELVKIVLESLGKRCPEGLEHVSDLSVREVNVVPTDIAPSVEKLEQTSPEEIERLLGLVPEWSEVHWSDVETQEEALLKGLGV